MTDSQAALLAQFSRVAYGDSVSIPNTWAPLPGFSDLTSNEAFEAVVYSTLDRSQIVIAFQGTDSIWSDWVGANLALTRSGGAWDYQFQAALNLTEAVKRFYPSATILVTGHSLGGSLAQVAAAMFGLDGAAFAPAGAQNVVQGAEFRSRAASWHIPEEDIWTPGIDFTNYVVVGSLIGPVTDANVGRDVLIAVDVAEAIGLSIRALAAPPATGILIAGYIQFETLHARERIAEYMVARAEGRVAEYFDVRTRDALVDAQVGDFGRSGQSGKVGTNSWVGSEEPNYMFTDNGDNAVQGLAGDDQVFTYAGNDTVDAGTGNDFVSTAQGDDVIEGGAGNDEVFAGSGNDTVDGGTGSDTIDAGAGDDTVVVTGSSNSHDSVDGGAGSDVLTVDYSALNGSQGYVVTSVEGLNTRLNNTASFQVIRDTLAGAQSFTIELNTGAQTKYTNVEHVNLTTSTLAPTNDLLIFQGGTSYHGGAGFSMASSSGVDSGDTFFADWSAATTDITWVNVPSTTQVVNGVSISGIERLLLATGSGNDRIVNSVANTRDEIYSGAGNDTISVGSDSSVDAGPGNDTITVAGSMNSRDSIDGGDGSDVLSIDCSSLDGSQSYVVASAAGLNTRLNNTASFQVIRDTLAGAQSFTIELNTGAQTKYINVEHVNLTTSTLAPINDLLIFQGGTSYHGGAGFSMASSSGVDSGDTFFADWSVATTDITWVNVPSTTQVVNGVSISGIERLLVATGNGDDTVTNSAVNTDDEIHAGAGNDLVAPGGGSDRVFGDAGLDTVAFGDARSAHSIARNGSMLTVSSRTGAIDTLVDVERLQFSDLSLAFDTEGNAGRAARLIGTLFGRQYVEDKPIVGLALGLLDSGMSYPALIAAAVATPAFAALAGSHSNADFVRAVYRNLVGVSPPAADLASLTGLLDSGQQTQASLALIACDLELTGVRVDLAGIASEGLGYFPWMG